MRAALRAPLRLLAALLVLGSVAEGCARHAGPALDPAAGATLRVDNQAFLDANIYALRGGQRIRIGTVTGNSIRTFQLPRSLVGTGVSIQFLADFIGSSRAPVSENVVIWAGDEVELRIPFT